MSYRTLERPLPSEGLGPVTLVPQHGATDDAVLTSTSAVRADSSAPRGLGTIAAFARRELPMLVGAGTLALFFGIGAQRLTDLGNPLQASLVFVGLFAVILYASIGVMRHADHLAHRLGEPLGTLVLTLSAISIEVSLIAALVLHGDQNPTIARDTMFAVLMIILNGLVGIALLVGALRHRLQDFNPEGTRSFLAIILPLAVVSMVLPNHTLSSPEGTLTASQGAIFAMFTLLLYGVFLAVQTRRHQMFFQEPENGRAAGEATQGNLGAIAEGSEARSTPYHVLLLFLTLLPVPLLAENLAVVVEGGIAKLGAPIELAGVVIAALVLAPEGMAAVYSAWRNKLQRAINVMLGSALSTIAVTIPVVVFLGLLTGHHIILGLQMENVVLLGLTLIVSMITFGGERTDLLKGAVHLVLFLIFLVLVIVP
jgi:Ca2+:H+ antiporter